MSKQPKSWFILRYNHFPPNTLIKLGQLIADPNEPHQAIDTSGPSAFPKDMPQVESQEEAFSWDVNVGSSGHVALSAEMDGLPVSATVQAEFKRNMHDWAQFKNLDTQLIAPTRGYVEASMMRPAVKTFLGKHFLPKSVFMITGLKIARGVERGAKRENMVGGGLDVGVTPSLGIPISLGPDVGGSVDRSEEIKAKVAKDFVWAVSLRQIYYRRGKVGKDRTFYDGATLEGRDDENRSDEEEEVADPSKLEIQVDDIDPNCFTGEGSRLVEISEKHVESDESLFLIAKKM